MTRKDIARTIADQLGHSQLQSSQIVRKLAARSAAICRGIDPGREVSSGQQGRQNRRPVEFRKWAQPVKTIPERWSRILWAVRLRNGGFLRVPGNGCVAGNGSLNVFRRRRREGRQSFDCRSQLHRFSFIASRFSHRPQPTGAGGYIQPTVGDDRRGVDLGAEGDAGEDLQRFAGCQHP